MSYRAYNVLLLSYIFVIVGQIHQFVTSKTKLSSKIFANMKKLKFWMTAIKIVFSKRLWILNVTSMVGRKLSSHSFCYLKQIHVHPNLFTNASGMFAWFVFFLFFTPPIQSHRLKNGRYNKYRVRIDQQAQCKLREESISSSKLDLALSTFFFFTKIKKKYSFFLCV